MMVSSYSKKKKTEVGGAQLYALYTQNSQGFFGGRISYVN